MSYFKNKATLFIVLLFAFVIIFLNFKNPPKNLLSYDVFGYYLYLPGTFIWHQSEFTDATQLEKINEKYHCTNTFYQLARAANMKYVDKYSLGLAILYLPFFLIGHLIALWFQFPVDGFSPPYQFSLLAGGFLYSIIGILFLRKVLLKYFSDLQSAITLFLVIFGTNYIYDAAYKGIMPHNLLFTIYCVIIWLTIKWHESQKTKYAIMLGLACGLTILSRPTEIVCLIIPIFWGVTDRRSFFEKIRLIKTHYKQLLWAALSIFLVWIPQLIHWKINTGQFLFYSYNNPGEGLDLLYPHTWNALFSFRKGWLIYTPVMIFGIIGLIALYRKNRPLFLPVLLFFIFNLYLVSSWTNWWYAESFGQRALIQSYPVIALPFGYFIAYITERRSRWPRMTILLVSLSFIALNSFQIWQLNHGILDASRMTRKYYFSIFGQTSPATEDQKKLLIIARPSTSVEHLTNEIDFNRKILKIVDFEIPLAEKNKNYDSITVHNGKYSFRLDSTMEFSPGIDVRFKDFTRKDYAWIRASIYVFPTADVKANDGILVVTFSHHGKYYKYRGRSLSDPEFNVRPRQWNIITADYITPEIRSKNDRLSVYFWYRGKAPVYVDDLQIDVFEENK
jgi:hypothetical protein